MEINNFRVEDTLAKALEMWEKGNTKNIGHPADWAEKKANVKLWSKQREICSSVMNNPLTAVKAGVGIGKSLTAATIADWWIDTHPVGEAFVISTAPSKTQIHAILWAEMLKMHTKGNLPGEIQLSDQWIIGKTLVGQGKKPHDYNKHAFHGIHRKFVLGLLDEACGIPEWIWEAMDSVTTGEHCRILAIGNPDDPSSHFAKICKPGSGWNTITIGVFDSPNFTDEPVDNALKDVLTSQKWVDIKRHTWGEDSPIWQSRILGQFPDLDEYATIPWGWVQAAQERYKEWVEEGSPKQLGRKIIGADIARFGKDATVFAHRQGDLCSKLEVFRKQDTEVTADLLAARLYMHEDVVVVDDNGLGGGVTDKLRRRGFTVRPFISQAKCISTDRSREYTFPNMRSAAWWHMRELLDPAFGSAVMLVDNEDLAAELIAPRWTLELGAKIRVESKEDIKKRIGRSTDSADAVIMAFWIASGVHTSEDEASFYWTDAIIDGGAVGWVENESLMEEFGINKEVALW